MSLAPATDLAPRVFSRNIADFEIPHGREEEWRFMPVAKIGDFFELSELGSVSAQQFDPYVHMVDLDDHRLNQQWLPTDRVSAVARGGVNQAVLITIPDDTHVAEPLVVNLTATGQRSYGHVEIVAGKFSQAQVVLIHDPSTHISGNIVTTLKEQANLSVLSVLDSDHKVNAHWSWTADLGRDSTFLGLSITMGGGIIRTLPTIRYNAPGGNATMLGAFLLNAHQFQEHRILVDHTQPHCSSKVIYKGALSGEGAHSVWVGDVLVRREAVGIETYELNRNLLLDDGPRADSVPNLELETGDVIGAGHASATGRFDDEQLFYLQSRGISEKLARQLIVRGFFVEVLAHVADKTLRAELMSRIESKLGIEAESVSDLISGSEL